MYVAFCDFGAIYNSRPIVGPEKTVTGRVYSYVAPAKRIN